MDNYTNNIQNEKQDKKDEKPLPGEKLGLGTMIAAGTGQTTMAVRVAGAAGELTILGRGRWGTAGGAAGRTMAS